jgi:phosphoribosylformimino-5-aminoimidazole carboxamide ribonucleotide (ProFAR) isomerase
VEQIKIQEEPEGSPLKKKNLEESPVRITSQYCSRGIKVSETVDLSGTIGGKSDAVIRTYTGLETRVKHE